MTTRTCVNLLLVLSLALGLAQGADAKRRTARLDRAFAIVVLDAAEAIVAAAQGQPVEPRWYAGTGVSDPITETQSETLEAVAAMGEIEVVITALELEATAHDASPALYLRSLVTVSPEGRVRWMQVSVRESAGIGMSEDLHIVAPELGAGLTRLTDALSDPGCPVPVYEVPEEFPPALRRETEMNRGDLARACGAIEGTAYSWVPRVDDVTVLIRSGDHYVALRSSFQVIDGQLVLESVRARELD